jgi:hypothetical protein
VPVRVERILIDDVVVALKIRASEFDSGVEFVTDPHNSLQIGLMSRRQGHQIEPHVHLPASRTILDTQEVLLIRKGIVRVDFYAPDESYASSALLHAGDLLLLSCGGHGFEVIEDAEIIEVKQGPFINDKRRFSDVEAAS